MRSFSLFVTAPAAPVPLFIPSVLLRVATRVCPVIIVTALCLPGVHGQDYINLIDADMTHWMHPDGKDVAPGWAVEPGGVLHLKPKAGHIVSREEFGDFELWFEFRISEKGNSGIKYRVRQYDKAWLGLEYQILDDAAFPKLTRDHLTASLYDLVLPRTESTRFNPSGEFNVGKIRVENGVVSHWINGQLTIRTPLQGPSWEGHVAASKFRNREQFGQNTMGRLMLTDHNSEVWYRNVFVRRLNTAACACVSQN